MGTDPMKASLDDCDAAASACRYVEENKACPVMLSLGRLREQVNRARLGPHRSVHDKLLWLIHKWIIIMATVLVAQFIFMVFSKVAGCQDIIARCPAGELCSMGTREDFERKIEVAFEKEPDVWHVMTITPRPAVTFGLAFRVNLCKFLTRYNLEETRAKWRLAKTETEPASEWVLWTWRLSCKETQQ